VTTIGTYASAYDEMQAWSAKRSEAMATFQTQSDTLTAALTGTISGSDAFTSMMTGGASTQSSTFISNDALSSALFDGTANALSGEETLMANIIYTRMMKQQQDQAAQLDSLTSTLDTLG
jgi:hypothetical protein